ncbi:MAG: response regulator, partial [Lachnospiraceae bacterium]|nr:response regulator [Lachnospiraceae bacterium]
MEKWIVVVDDEVLSLKNIKMLLSSDDMRVSCLKSGNDLLTFMSKNDPDIILMDIMMPQMDGFETYRRLEEKLAEEGKNMTPVIFLTGETDAERERDGLKLGASDYIHKPIDKQVLISRIENIISNNKKIKSLEEDASTDKLTGFLNKTVGEEKITAMCEENNGIFVILDLDNFKPVND